MTMQTADYQARVTSEHNLRPKYMAVVALTVQPFVDNQALLATLPTLFDLDVAVGQQLDYLGAWVGEARGALDDTTYRVLLQALVAINHWDGTVPGIYNIWSTVFGGASILVADNKDMTMFIVFVTQSFTPAELVLLHAGAFDLRPAGVKMLGYYQPSVAGHPVFGLDVENSNISGLDVGYFVQPL